jgi:phenylalanyl-tRNA synthetase beta chain
MKVSLPWLQKYFTEPLPAVDEIVDTLTFHSSEVEEVIGEGENTVFDIKVLPDRASYGLSHRGIAYELAAALNRPLAEDPLRTPLVDWGGDANAERARVSVSIEDTEKCRRYMAARITGVKVGPSPEWLKTALERIGQRSINNVVDATNYVMLNIGQPLHAFDAAKLTAAADGGYAISVRAAHDGEKITTLTGEEFTLTPETLVITDGTSGDAVGIAGVKGGKAAEITEATTDLIIESANFDGTSVRKTSQTLKLWTDASLRFQNKLSPEFAAYGMRDVVALILELAGGELQGIVDSYPNPEAPAPGVLVTLGMVNGHLGTSFVSDDLTNALTRLAFSFEVSTQSTGDFTVMVTPSFERRDIVIWQDLAEEIGRIIGYEHVEPVPLPPLMVQPDQTKYRGIEAIKDILTQRGFTEISTPSFAGEGEIILANPLQSERPWLRASLSKNMEDALGRAASVAPRVLGPEPMLKLFEIGTVFTKEGEYLSLALGYRQLTGKPSAAVLADAVDALLSAFPDAGITRAAPSASTPAPASNEILELSLRDVAFESIGKDAVIAQYKLGPYQTFSIYPSALRDIAVWTPAGTEESELTLLIQEHAGDLLARMDLFDRFEKTDDAGTRISYAFRLVFQAIDRTLSDADIDPNMTAITDALNAKEGCLVR